jgi:hypothetical protein
MLDVPIINMNKSASSDDGDGTDDVSIPKRHNSINCLIRDFFDIVGLDSDNDDNENKSGDDDNDAVSTPSIDDQERMNILTNSKHIRPRRHLKNCHSSSENSSGGGEKMDDDKMQQHRNALGSKLFSQTIKGTVMSLRRNVVLRSKSNEETILDRVSPSSNTGTSTLTTRMNHRNTASTVPNGSRKENLSAELHKGLSKPKNGKMVATLSAKNTPVKHFPLPMMLNDKCGSLISTKSKFNRSSSDRWLMDKAGVKTTLGNKAKMNRRSLVDASDKEEYSMPGGEHQICSLDFLLDEYGIIVESSDENMKPPT